MGISPQSFGKVGVILGGSSAEREVSLRSGQAVFASLANQGFDVIKIDPSTKDIEYLYRREIQCAFLMLHGRGGEDGTIQGLLEYLGIPYTGSGVLGSALCMDKNLTKKVWIANGLPTPKYRMVESGDLNSISLEALLAELGGCVMVKPVKEGSSIGMAKVSLIDEFSSALSQAFKFDDKVLVEQFITGQEYTVAVLNNQALPSIRLATPHTFYDYSAKYVDSTTSYYCPSGLDDSDEAELGALVEKAFHAAGCKGWGRIDVMRDQDGQFLLLESNTAPGMTETSLVPKAAKQAGLSFDQLLIRILETVEILDESGE